MPNLSIESNSPSSTFANVTWAEGFQELAAISGLSFDPKNAPSGNFDIARLQGLSPAAAMDAMNGMLFARGLNVIQKDHRLSVMKLSDVTPAAVPLVSLDQLEACFPNQFVRVEFPLRYVQAGPIAEELGSQKSQFGHVSRLGHSTRQNCDSDDNGIRIVDSAQSVKQICTLIAKAEQVAEAAAEERTFEADPENLLSIRCQLLRLAELQLLFQSQLTPSWMSASPKTFNVQISEGSQDNTVTVIALPQQIAAMDAFLRFVTDAANQPTYFTDETLITREYTLRSVDPQRLSDLLADSPEFTSTQRRKVDEQNRIITLTASWRQHKVVVELLGKLEPGKRQSRTIQLRSISSEKVAAMIRHAFANRKRSADIRSATEIETHIGTHVVNKDEFSVKVKLEENQLQLLCTDGERQEIHDFLEKFGVWRDESHGWTQALDAGPFPQQLVIPLSRLQLPVSTSIDADGQIILHAQDFGTLDRAVQELSQLIRNPHCDRKIPIKYVSAYWLLFNLEGSLETSKAETAVESAVPSLVLNVDPKSNALLVLNASSNQMQSIEWLVAANDIPN
ncbi:MAG: hypothetical protein SFV81_03365 [Pirellulaceae bacterium]|nr:hypothetical protein [Pirellulaceae bacterium]